MSETSEKQTVVEEGTEVEGGVRSQCAVVVRGQLKGDVVAPTLTLTPEGSVFGKVQVKQLKSEGSLGGEIEAESVELSGTVSDDSVIRASVLEAKLQESEDNKLRVRFGNCELYVGDPSKKLNAETTGDNNQRMTQEPLNV